MKSAATTLEKQLAKKEKELEAIKKKIETAKAKNKPKSIMDQVKTMKDVIRLAKPTKEEKAVIEYSGKSKRLLFAKHVLIVSLISEVLNEGWEPNMDGSEDRYYPWVYLSSGFAFNNTNYGHVGAHSSSASRLCLKSDELAEYAGKTFEQEYKNFIVG